MMKEYDKSIKNYDEAIEVFRKAYGNDHNENTAVAIAKEAGILEEDWKDSKEDLTVMTGKEFREYVGGLIEAGTDE